MVRKLLATTAIAVLMGGAAYAQEGTAPAPAQPAPMDQAAPAETAVPRAEGHLASNLIGETVYNGTGDNAENIGEVNDLVVGSDGHVNQVVVGVGGFLGIGEKNVVLNYDEISWANNENDNWIVVNATREQLEAQPAFDARAYDPAVAPPATAADGAAPAATDTMATAPADGTTTREDMAEAPATDAAPADDMAAAPAPAAPADTTAAAPAETATPDQTQTAAIDRSTLSEMPADQLSADNLIGTDVYGANEENVGEISDIVLTADGAVDAVVLDVGGFLGIGAKPVALGMDKLQFMTDGNGNNYLYTTFTKEQLEAATAYDEGTWAEQRDQQRVIMQ